jgi:hypothetical protein
MAGKLIDKLKKSSKKLRAGIASRKIDLMKKTKANFGIPSNVPNFSDKMTKIFDGK